jgi:4-diphosphocytidyl-2-C-methyl-D-erythritol kinase
MPEASLPERLHLRAPAKLNLALAVGAAGADGMHPIASWMVTVGLWDELDLRRLPAGSLSRFAIEWHPEARRRTAIDWPITADLAVRAHQALERTLGRSLPVQMRLRKRIPVGGGLGGGSSDAAAMLRGLERLFRLELDPATRGGLASSLGSDVPFLLEGGSGLVEGVGERVEPLGPPPPLHAVLILPEESCPTGAVYRRFDLLPPRPFDPARVREIARQAHASVAVGEAAIFNDLAEAAFLERPTLRELAAALRAAADRQVHLSGSGSTLFVLATDAGEARAIAVAVEDRLGVPTVPVAGVVLAESSESG